MTRNVNYRNGSYKNNNWNLKKNRVKKKHVVCSQKAEGDAYRNCIISAPSNCFTKPRSSVSNTSIGAEVYVTNYMHDTKNCVNFITNCQKKFAERQDCSLFGGNIMGV